MKFKESKSHDWHYLESPKNSIPNFHSSWIWVFQFPQGLQGKHLPSNYTSLPRQNKQYRICFWHFFHLVHNSSTPVDAPATWELLQIYAPSVSDSSHPPLPVTHRHTSQSLHLSGEEVSTHAKHTSSACTHRSFPRWSTLVPYEQSREATRSVGGNKNGCKMT